MLVNPYDYPFPNGPWFPQDPPLLTNPWEPVAVAASSRASAKRRSARESVTLKARKVSFPSFPALLWDVPRLRLVPVIPHV